VTGWHGRLGPALGVLGRAVDAASGMRVGLAPSVFAIARPAAGAAAAPHRVAPVPETGAQR
jgi:hypothetical protein